MQNKIALIGIIIEEMSAVDQVNALLHDYSDKIIGRMGIPYRARGLCIISIVIDALADEISALCGKLGNIPGISVKSMQAKTA